MNEINLSAFEASCVDLILQGHQEKVEQIINAFNDVDNRFEALHQLIELSPHSLDGMLLAFNAKEMRESPLDFTVWPHSVLLNSASDVQSIEQFMSLLNAVETTVEWEDTFTCVKQLVQNLSVNAVEDIVVKVEQLGRLKVLLLAYLFEIVIKSRESYSFSPDDLLNQMKRELEQVRKGVAYYSLYASWLSHTWGESKKEIFPETLYMLSLFEVLRVLPNQQFPEDYRLFQSTAFEFFYRETDTFSRWDRNRFRFFWAYKQTLSAINHELVDRWQTLMQEIERNWAE